MREYNLSLYNVPVPESNTLTRPSQSYFPVCAEYFKISEMVLKKPELTVKIQGSYQI